MLKNAALFELLPLFQVVISLTGQHDKTRKRDDLFFSCVLPAKQEMYKMKDEKIH